MSPANASAAQSQTHNQIRTTNGDSKLKKRKRSVADITKTEFTADFVVGALLYSLLGSSRSETVVSFLPEDEQD